MLSRSFAAIALVCSLAAALDAGRAWADCTLDDHAAAGKSVSNICKACHEFAADKPSRATGPNLHEVYGSVAGSRDDFKSYSEGMKGAHDKGVKWDDQTLFDYIADPKGFLDKVNGHEVGHAMSFQLRDEQKRKDVIAFLAAIKGKAECN